MQKTNMRKLAVIALTLVAFTTFAPLAMATGFNAKTVTLASYVAGDTTTLTAIFEPVSGFNSMDKFILTLPAGFAYQSGGTNVACTYQAPLIGTTNIQSSGISFSGQDITFTRNTMGGNIDTALAITCVYTLITNTSTSGGSGVFPLATQRYNLISRGWDAQDSDSAAGVTITAAPSNVPEFSTYMYILTILAAGWMLKNKFQKQGQEI